MCVLASSVSSTAWLNTPLCITSWCCCSWLVSVGCHCSHVCALANERPTSRLCACISPPGHHHCVGLCHACAFVALASLHSLALSTSFHPDDDAPNDARRAPTVVRRSTLDALNLAPNRRSTQFDIIVRYTMRACVPLASSCGCAFC